MVLTAWLNALEVLEAAAAGRMQLPQLPPPRQQPWEAAGQGDEAAEAGDGEDGEAGAGDSAAAKRGARKRKAAAPAVS